MVDGDGCPRLREMHTQSLQYVYKRTRAALSGSQGKGIGTGTSQS